MEYLLALLQITFTVIIGVYFYNQLKSQQNNKIILNRESSRELEKLKKQRLIKLTEPLSEKTRPSGLDEIVGQQQGLRALKAALCGPNPQHVIIYGPPGVGKTAAARVVLEEAKKSRFSPFNDNAVFNEVDATTLRFDERGIADPLIGSVHDPIYQGAGIYGSAGVPQPKPGAVTKAHGGILFIDEIGELHPIQMNKLLKVLEDRKVFLESAYYNENDKNIPAHIHEIFKFGLPADFRLVGATTRSSSEIPQAIRSRCTEIFFRPLYKNEIAIITANAAIKAGFVIESKAQLMVCDYAENGRDAVNIVQTAAGIAILDGRRAISESDVTWVIEFGHYNLKNEKRVDCNNRRIGFVNGLAVRNGYFGHLLEIEAFVCKNIKGDGKLIVTGFVDEQQYNDRYTSTRVTGSAKASAEIALCALKSRNLITPELFDIHVNIPGGIPADGPSAGIAIAAAVYSALSGQPVDENIAMTGEITVRGDIRPVGGIIEKIEAASRAGINKIFLPKENMGCLNNSSAEIVYVSSLDELFAELFDEIPEKLPVEIPGELSLKLPGDMSAKLPGELPAKLPGEMPIKLPLEMPEESAEELPIELPLELPEVLSARKKSVKCG